MQSFSHIQVFNLFSYLYTMAVKLFKLPEPLSGRVNQNFLITRAAIQGVKTGLADIFIPDAPTDEPISQSYLDTPVIDNLKFPEGKYTDLQDNEIPYSEVIVDTVLFEVNLPRNIIKTPIQGRDGTVKEYVSNGDFQITCRGMVSNRDNVFPLEGIRVLRTALEVPQQIPIVSLFLNDVFSIFNIVIDRFNISQVEGKRNEVPFSFVAYSDVELDAEELV
jgi:hypothetical protein